MTEINVHNFHEKFPEIQNSLERAKFIAIDLEYSALYPLKHEKPSLFDNTVERYAKVRKNMEHVIPLQIGLTAFSHDSSTGSYIGTIYNFYLVPISFATVQKPFYFQPETLSFLKYHGFNFNKFVYSGVTYMNKATESTIKKALKEDIGEGCSIFKNELHDIYELQIDNKLKNWSSTAQEGEGITLTEFYKKYEQNHEILYFTQKYIRRNFKDVWTFIKNGDLVVEKISSVEYKNFQNNFNLEEELISALLGFTKVFRILTSLKKPLIGHNLFQDILLMYESFEEPLPHSYSDFKRITNQLFPIIFDTRVIAYDVERNLITREKRWREKGLESIFEYFKNGTGRHLALNSPAIVEAASSSESIGKFHDAGWDSFCTGYIFIRMAYLNIHDKYPKSKSFVASELIAGLSHFKNRLNIIRGFNSTVCMDGEDPESTRPPILVLESLKTKSIDIQQIASILSTCGFVEVKRLPYTHKRALIAVDNFGSARRILTHFQNNKDFHVTPYSTLRHSSLARSLVLGSLTISAALLAAFVLKK